jgi:uncharacterized protein YaaW (UPF0174 family)
MIDMRILIAAVFVTASTIASAAESLQHTLDQAAADYFSCVERFAKILALDSDETAEVIAQKSLSACSGERKVLIESNRSHWNEKTADNAFVERLISKITEIRARRAVMSNPPRILQRP